MEDFNYKKLDRKAILDFVGSQKGVVEVSKVISDSGANRLRVYPILFELKMEGKLEVIQATDLGTPLSVKLV